eukprot:CAMPEP_0114250324 /NCGR_PEP_ID=MMETSP0058-20121206/14636_1 /TAXON_ID=36894 /ORGANISM="Pyramimonas parkeae, CCMP726" /LENGTH=237 /DNA_ID=CAMNT_0001363971 /DNA_START=486 /DNA_END=1199 /DNA_ORIENTATION=-
MDKIDSQSYQDVSSADFQNEYVETMVTTHQSLSENVSTSAAMAFMGMLSGCMDKEMACWCKHLYVGSISRCTHSMLTCLHGIITAAGVYFIFQAVYGGFWGRRSTTRFTTLPGMSRCGCETPEHAHAREDVRWNTPMTTLICNEQPLEGDGRHIFKSEQLDPDRELTLNAHTCRRGCPRDDDFFQQQRTYSLVDASPDMDDDSAMWDRWRRTANGRLLRKRLDFEVHDAHAAAPFES